MQLDPSIELTDGMEYGTLKVIHEAVRAGKPVPKSNDVVTEPIMSPAAKLSPEFGRKIFEDTDVKLKAMAGQAGTEVPQRLYDLLLEIFSRRTVQEAQDVARRTVDKLELQLGRRAC